MKSDSDIPVTANPSDDLPENDKSDGSLGSGYRAALLPGEEPLREALEPFVHSGRVDEAAVVARAVIYAERRSGPLPDASEFRLYEEALPGTGHRVVAMAEDEQRHRHSMEKKALSDSTRENTLGQHYSLIALIAMLLLVGFFCYDGHPREGVGLGVAIILTVVAIFRGEKILQAFGRNKSVKKANIDDEDSEE